MYVRTALSQSSLAFLPQEEKESGGRLTLQSFLSGFEGSLSFLQLCFLQFQLTQYRAGIL
jgi:hypothetical protein